jgi:DNA repair protein RadA/Sms
MVKESRFVCQQCGYETPRWFGKCPECGQWGTLVETVVSTKTQSSKLKAQSGKNKLISLVSVARSRTSRISTKISELDRVLGGGLVSGQVTLIAGEPGIGKSTILLQLADKLARPQRLAASDGGRGNVLYASGEESVAQIKIRADRLGIGKSTKGRSSSGRKKTIYLIEETDIDLIIQLANQQINQPTVLIIDSIQTMTTSDLSGMAGSVGQVRECAYRLVKFAKSNNTPVFIAGHVTKGGMIAGPSVLMHIVDTVLWFEGEKSLTLRVLRAVKNRFGPTDEVGIFSMEDKGLKPVSNPEKAFLTKGGKKVAGYIVTSILEGTRPILTEIQSLVVPTKLVYPRRIAQGIDSKRLEVLLAVLQRRCGLPLYEYDCFINVAGGINIKNDPSVDLAVCLAITSAFYDKPLSRKTIAVGEVGLLGDIREVIAQEKRIKEARRIGYSNIITNKEAKYLQEAIKTYLR